MMANTPLQPTSFAGRRLIGMALGGTERRGDTKMPTVLREGPYRVYFVSHDLREPPHVHVDRDDCSAKF